MLESFLRKNLWHRRHVTQLHHCYTSQEVYETLLRLIKRQPTEIAVEVKNGVCYETCVRDNTATVPNYNHYTR